MFLTRRSQAALLGRPRPQTSLAWSLLGLNTVSGTSVAIPIAPLANALLLTTIISRRNTNAASVHTCVDSASNTWVKLADVDQFTTNGVRVTLWALRLGGTPGAPTVTIGSTPTTSLGGSVVQVVGAGNDLSNVSPAAGATSVTGDPVAILPAAPSLRSLVWAAWAANGAGTVYPDAPFQEVALMTPSGLRGQTAVGQTDNPYAGWQSTGAEGALALLEVKEA
jgi:hypothetical protein